MNRRAVGVSAVGRAMVREMGHAMGRAASVAAVAVGLGASAAHAQPSNDRCPDARVITADLEFTGTNIAATSDLQGTSCGSFLDPLDIWFRFVAPADGTYVFDTLGADFDTTLAAYTQCSGNGASGLITCNDDEPGGDTWSQIVVPLTSGQAAVIRLAGFGAQEGNYSIFVSPSTPASGVCCFGVTCTTNVTPDQCAGAFRVFVAAGACNAAGDAITPCCRADFNKQAGLTVQDVFDFLAAWFSGSPSADWVGNGSLAPGVQSIFDFLAAWFAGGC